MNNLIMPNNFSFMKYAEKSVPGLADVGVPHGDGDGPRTPPRCMEGVWKKFQMTYFTMPIKMSSMKHALKSDPGLADVGVPHGDGHGPRTPPRCMGRVWKKFQMTNFDMPKNVSFMKYPLKSVPGITDVGVPHGDGDGPRTPP